MLCGPWGSLAVLFSWWITQADHRAPRLANWVTHMHKQRLHLWTASAMSSEYRRMLLSMICNIFQIFNPLSFFFHGSQPCIIKAAAIRSVSYKWVFSLALLESKAHTSQKSKILLSQFTWHSDITIKYKLTNHKTSCYHANLIFWNNLLV